MGKSPDAFRTISEVAELLDIPAHVLRFWESRFTQVKPVKRAGGRRYYRRADILLLDGIRRLLHDDGFTIRGVQKLLREEGVRRVAAHGQIDIGEEDEAFDGDVPEAPLALDVEPEDEPSRILPFPNRLRRGPQIVRAGQPQTIPAAELAGDLPQAAATQAPENTSDTAESAAPLLYRQAAAEEAGLAEISLAPYFAAPSSDQLTLDPAAGTEAAEIHSQVDSPTSAEEQDMTPAPTAFSEDDSALRRAAAALDDTGPLIEAWRLQSEARRAAPLAETQGVVEAAKIEAEALPETSGAQTRIDAPIETVETEDLAAQPTEVVEAVEAVEAVPPQDSAQDKIKTWLSELPADPEDGDARFAVPPLPLGRLHPGLPGLRPLYARLSRIRVALGESSRQRFGARS